VRLGAWYAMNGITNMVNQAFVMSLEISNRFCFIVWQPDIMGIRAY
jgi:hypothetical protein